MKTARKLLVTLLVLTFVLGTMSFGFAAPAEEAVLDVNKLVSDIENKDVKDAVRRLNAFGIINGMEDGKYHPETKLTREQFAKILVTSLKMDHAAKAGVGYKTFSDVAADRWSAGYIGVASGQGLIKGYPDGTFKPAKEVSYAEAVTMLVRALGYKDEFLPGTWPGNYLAKGAEKDVTKKVRFADAAGVVDRADAALLVNNTLDAKVVKVDEYEGNNIKYRESNLTLLEDKFNVVKLEDTRIVATKRLNDGLAWDEVKVGKETYDLEGFNPETILGEEVTVYVNDDDEVVYAESENDDKVYFDYVEEIANDKLSLVKFDDDYPFADRATVFMKDGDKVSEIDLDDVDINVFLGKAGKFVVNNNKIVWAEIMDSTEAEPWFIVMNNDDGLLKGICADDDEHEVDLRKDEDFDDVIVLDIDGNEVKVKDIEKGNLLYVQKQEIDGDDYAVVRVVKDNIVEGKLDRVEDKKVKIGDKNLKVVNYVDDSGKQFDAYYSIDNGDEIKQYLLSKDDVSDDMEDADEEDIVAYTDAVGRVAYFVTTAKSASGYKYGIVTKIYSDHDRIKVYTVDDKGEGDEITYTMEEDKNIEDALALNKFGQKTDDPATVTEGSPVKFKLNSKGEIAEDKIYVLDVKDAWRIYSADDFGRDYLPTATHFSSIAYDADAPANAAKADGATEEKASFSVNDNVIIIDAETYELDSNLKPVYDSGEFDPANWKDLAKANGMDGFFYVFADDDNPYEAKAVVFIDKGSGAASDDEMPIYVIKKWMKGGDDYVSYHAYDGQVEERVLDNKLYDKKEHPYVAKIKSNGKLEIIAKDAAKDFDIYYGQVKKKDASSLTMEKVFKYEDDSVVSQDIFNISSKTLVYEEDSKKTTSSLKANDIIIFVVEKGSNVRVIERLIDTEYDEYATKIGE